MPIYEYQCEGCHHTFDLIQKMNDDMVKLCPNCSKETAVRLVSAAGFQLKGTGWYATDFKTKSQPEKSTGTGKTSEKKETSASSDTGSAEKKSTESSAPSTSVSKDE